MATNISKNSYYYAGGKRVVLEPADDLVAVDDARLAEHLPALLKADAALSQGRPLRGGIRLLERKNLAASTIHRLQEARVTQPVFRQDGAIMVALPEIRVEDDDKSKLARVRKFAASQVQAIADGPAGRLTLAPISADGADAVTLANEIVEKCKVASVSPRFLRVVPGPVVRA